MGPKARDGREGVVVGKWGALAVQSAYLKGRVFKGVRTAIERGNGGNR